MALHRRAPRLRHRRRRCRIAQHARPTQRASARASCTHASAPRPCAASATWSAKLPVCGPTAMAQPRRAGSSGFCPPPGGEQAAADEGDRRRGGTTAPVSPSVSTIHTPSAGGGCRRARGGRQRVAGRRGDRGAALRMARRDDGQQARMRPRPAPVHGEDQRLLARMRAGGEPDRPAGQQRRAAVPAPPHRPAVAGRRISGRPARVDARSAECAQPCGVGLAARLDTRRSRRAPAAPAPARAASGRSCVRQPGVDQHRPECRARGRRPAGSATARSRRSPRRPGASGRGTAPPRLARPAARTGAARALPAPAPAVVPAASPR